MQMKKSESEFLKIVFYQFRNGKINKFLLSNFDKVIQFGVISNFNFPEFCVDFLMAEYMPLCI